MVWNPFNITTGATLLEQSEEAIAAFEVELAGYTKEKEQKTRRQVELWSVLTPSESLRSEYRDVSTHVAFLVKKMICLEAHLKELKLARYHAQNGNIERLEKALSITDPCENVDAKVEEVSYSI
jgi:hypothetical protein